MKLREYFLCAKKTKITFRVNRITISTLPCQSLTCVHDTKIKVEPQTILTDYFNAVLTTLNLSAALLSMQGQKALGFHKKYLNLCYEDEQRSYGFGTT